MTEEQARERWCPFTRYIGNYHGRLVQPQVDQTCCIASDCMAWRWVINRTTAYLKDGVPYTEYEAGPDGYCGLAGKQREI